MAGCSKIGLISRWWVALNLVDKTLAGCSTRIRVEHVGGLLLNLPYDGGLLNTKPLNIIHEYMNA